MCEVWRSEERSWDGEVNCECRSELGFLTESESFLFFAQAGRTRVSSL